MLQKTIKSLFCILCTGLFAQSVFAAGLDDFIIQVQTNLHVNLPFTSDDKSFTIPTKPGVTYNYNVDCNNDGAFEATNITGDYTCVYPLPDEKLIRIADNVGDGTGFPQIYFHDSGDKRKINDIIQWGTGKWVSMNSAFAGCDELQIFASDMPDLTLVLDLSEMFVGASLVNPNVSGWNTTNITNMRSMFYQASTANPDVSNWNTSSVTNMSHMFGFATSAIPDMSSWDVSGINTTGFGSMNFMLQGVTLPTPLYDAILANFNGQILNPGVVFDGGNSKYCNVAAHDNLTNATIGHGWTITDGGLDANCPVSTDAFVIEVDTTIAGSTTNTQFEINTFGGGYNYNVDCDGANLGTNTATAQTGNYICNYAAPGVYTIQITDNNGDKTGFPQILSANNSDAKKIIDLKQWGTGIWSNMNQAFINANNMIVSATDIPDLSNVTNMTAMFEFATSANPDVSNWNVANVTSMFGMFRGATSALPDMTTWNITGITTPSSMEVILQGITLPTSLYDAILTNFNGQLVNSGIVFDGGNSKYCNVAAHDGLINNHGWTITDGGLDPSCPSSADAFVIEVDTSIAGSTTNTQFEINTYASSYTYNYNVDCDDANAGTNTATGQTGNYTCNYTNPGVYTIRITDNIGDKTGFPRIRATTHADTKKIVDLKQWGTGIWISMNQSFVNAFNMIVTATDKPDLSQVLTTRQMFLGASLANPDTEFWDVSNISDMRGMFTFASSAIPDMSNWDITGVTSSFGSMEDMLNGITLPTALYDATLANFNAQITASGIVFSAGNSKYCNVAAHDSLINTHGWTITDGGLDANCPAATEDIFSNGFEDVIIFKAGQSQFAYDFSEVVIEDMGDESLLIAEGIDVQHKTVIQVYLRNDVGQLQIRLDKLDTKDSESVHWVLGQWQPIDNTKLTMISW